MRSFIVFHEIERVCLLAIDEDVGRVVQAVEVNRADISLIDVSARLGLVRGNYYTVSKYLLVLR